MISMRLRPAAAVDLDLLLALGKRLDSPAAGAEETVRQWLMEELLRIRTRQGELRPLRLNAAQRALERCAARPVRGTRKSIVLKARQLGITTYVAARFLVHTITRPGTLSVQVAHEQQAAEEIFRN